MRRLVMVELAAIVILVGLAVVLLIARGGDFNVHGAVVVDRANADSTNVGCTGTGRYDDIGAGTQVTIVSELGDVLAAGSLGPGSPGADGASCDFGFVLTGVADGERVYEVRIAGRGAVPFDKGDLMDSPMLFLGGG